MRAAANSIIRRSRTCWLAVHDRVDYLCKTARSLCVPWGNAGDCAPAGVHNRAVTWEIAIRALCIKKNLQFSTRHAVIIKK